MSSLWELTGNYLALAQRMEEDGFDPETIADTLEGNSDDLREKLYICAKMARNFDAEVATIKAAEEELAKRRKRKESRAQWMRDHILNSMKAAKIDKVDGPLLTIAVRNNPAAVIVDDESKIPKEYMRAPLPPPPPKPEPDKAQIAAAIKAGKEVPGCHINVNQRLEIKA